MMDLFESGLRDQPTKHAPLADRMRPRTLDQFLGQSHIIAPGRLLRRAIEADQLSSLIFYGPPGTGKTTLARIIAHSTKADFITINAVLAGVKEIRESITQAEKNFSYFSKRTILFVDEVHRFNKAQQDALLPHVENGIIILIGATTENPYFEVNKALVSRSRIFELRPLSIDELQKVAQQALRDTEYGYGRKKVLLKEDALFHLCNTASGDARSLLNALELAVETTVPQLEDDCITITMDIAEESIQKRAVLYDKDGDAHYDIISAFIKSIRGSDPDAALFWMAKMLYAGEDPRFILRRMVILASEDIGLADPQALSIVMAAAQAYDYIGMPEGRFPLSQACIYLATAPKSNSTLALFDALKSVEFEEKHIEVPNPLKDGSRDREGLGHGEGYLYPHAFREHWVAQQYLPSVLQGKVFYEPSHEGYEKKIATLVSRRREIQLASLLEQKSEETYWWVGGATGSWKQRTWNETNTYYEELRKDFFTHLKLVKEDFLLDLHAKSGLFTFEALRNCAYGGVWSIVRSQEEFEALNHALREMTSLYKPEVVPCSTMLELENELCAVKAPQFTQIIGRNIFTALPKDEIDALLGTLPKLVAPNAKIHFVQYDQFESTPLSHFIVDTNLRRILENLEKMALAEGAAWKTILKEACGHVGGTVQFEAREYKMVRRFDKKTIAQLVSRESRLGEAARQQGISNEVLMQISQNLSEHLLHKESEWLQKVWFIQLRL